MTKKDKLTKKAGQLLPCFFVVNISEGLYEAGENSETIGRILKYLHLVVSYTIPAGTEV